MQRLSKGEINIIGINQYNQVEYSLVVQVMGNNHVILD
uniref:Uncharacterized protein n=1 Tax=Staphylococcus phage 184DA TaxID=3110532 RepID=A0AAU6MX56_9CAUD